MKLLPRKVGLFWAREMVFWGKVLKAEEALGWGLVNAVTEKKALEAAYEFARRLEASPSKPSALFGVTPLTDSVYFLDRIS